MSAEVTKRRQADGGHAFPLGAVPGMALRDYFAAKAMSAMIAEGSVPQMNAGESSKSATARHAYQYAGKMLAERKK